MFNLSPVVRISLGALIVVVLLWWAAARYGLIASGDFPSPDESKWQAVFLSNSQVYFGHLENYDHGYVRLMKVYYLRAAGDLQQGGGSANQNLNLVKLGGELHGPEDAMFIPKDKIQFWENLKSSSQVVQSIESSGPR